MGKIVAVANQKGGVGKTTSVINLSAAVALLGKRTLLVDMDPQGNATSGCGVNKRKLERSVYTALAHPQETAACILKTGTANLFLLPSSIDLAGAELELVGLDKREGMLKQALASVRDEFDFVFIDCPPSLALLTLNALCAADSVLIPIQCEYFALEGLSQLTNTIKLVKRNYNPGLEIEGVLLTMYDGRQNLSIQSAEEVKKYFNDKLYTAVIPRNVRLSEAPSYGMPIFEYDRFCKGAMAYKAVGEEFLRKNAGEQP